VIDLASAKSIPRLTQKVIEEAPSTLLAKHPPQDGRTGVDALRKP